MGAMDKAKAKLREMTGDAKEKMGEHTDDPDLQAEGEQEKTEGSLQDAVEQAKDAGEKARDAFRDR
ncbi:MAG TPA: CsbD family protein [Acidimicrobiales bacterium]